MSSDTADRILDAAEDLIQRRGFNAFSFQDVAERVGVRKASLHYHFPCKTELGVAVLRRFAARGLEVLGEPDGGDHHAKLDRLFLPFHVMASDCDRMCLGGVLAAEMGSLPPEMKAEIAAFISGLENWLARLIADGRKAGAFRPGEPPEMLACMAVAALEGGLMTARAGDAPARLAVVIGIVRRLVAGDGA